VTIGGLSVLDFANVPNYSATFVVYKGWKERGQGPEPGPDRRQPQPPAERHPGSLPLRRHSAADRGLGQTGGFQMMVEDRRAWAWPSCSGTPASSCRTANSNPSLRGLATTFSYRSPQLYLDIDRTKASRCRSSPASVFEALQSYLGSSFVNFFNSFNQVFQVYIQADSRYRLEPDDLRHLYVRNQNGGWCP
jgi:HAE1 family hydrophobic/amphiphilic exporter-1